MKNNKRFSKHDNNALLCTESQNWIIIKNISERMQISTDNDQFAILWVNSGIVSLDKECGFIYLCEQELLFIPPNNKYNITHVSNNTEAFLFKLNTSEFLNSSTSNTSQSFFKLDIYELVEKILKKNLCIHFDTDALFITSVIDLITIDLHSSPASLKQDILVSDINNLIYRIAMTPKLEFSPLNNTFSTNNIMAWILKYIKENYSTVTIIEIAEKLHYNPDYLSSYIYKTMNKTFSQLLLERRMVCAKSLINNTNISLKNIAQQIGYKDYSSFYRAFLSYFEQSPRKFRNEIKQK